MISPFPVFARDIFSLGFGPFRWVCTSGNPQDLAVTDNIAATILEEISANVSDRIRQQYNDNIRWIREAGKHKMVDNFLTKCKSDEEKAVNADYFCVFSLFRLWDPKPESSTLTRKEESPLLWLSTRLSLMGEFQ